MKRVSILMPEHVGKADISLYEVSKSRNNIVEDWKKAGAPDYLRYDEKETWRNRNRLEKSDRDFRLAERENQLWLELEMETPGIVFIDLELN